MNKRRTTIFAVLAVLLMAAVPLMAVVPAADATAEKAPIPTMKDYAYAIKYNTSTTAIEGVYVDADIAHLGDSNYKATSVDKNHLSTSSWTFDSNGLGPFNSFYAAINLATNADTTHALNTTVGKIAYVLDPGDLSKDAAGNSVITDENKGNFNIMLVIPTVYWYSDTDNGVLYVSNTRSNPNIPSSILYDDSGASREYRMQAYAHTVHAGSSADSTTTIYPYLGLGVYEASTNATYGLVSQSGNIPTASTTLGETGGETASFRKLVDGNSGSGYTNAYKEASSVYGIWNFYEWTLYKIMSQAVIGSKDAQAAIGMGTSTNVDGTTANSASKSGNGDSAGPYAASSAVSGNDSYSKLFIENSWGSVWEFVDNTYLSNGTIFAGDGLTSTLSNTNVAVTGYQYASGKSIGATANEYSNTKTFNQHADSVAWDMPSGKTDTNSVSGDAVWSNSGNRCLIVGGAWANGASVGLSAWHSNFALSISSTLIGARLAYLMSADAADSSNTLTAATVEHGSVTISASGAVTGQLVSFDVNPESGYRLASVSISYNDGEAKTITPSSKTLDRGAFTMVGYAVTVTPTFEAVTSVSLSAGDGGSTAISGSGDSSIKVLSTATYTVGSGYIQITDTVLGASKTYLILAQPSAGYNFNKFTNGSGGADIKGTGSISGSNISSIYSVFAADAQKYVITFVEGYDSSTARTTSTTVTAGTGVQLPAVEDLPDYEFSGWYSNRSGSEGSYTYSGYVGPAMSYFVPSSTSSIYAKYDTLYSVSFYEYGSDAYETSPSQSVTGLSAGDVFNIPAALKKVTGYEFSGWYNPASAPTTTITISDPEYRAGTLYTASGNRSVSLYATYVLDTVATITYKDANDNTITTIATSGVQTGHIGEAMPLINAPAVEGSTFIGWYSAATGGILAGTPGQAYYPMVSNTDLYARYTVDPITVTFKKEDGSTEAFTMQYTPGDKVQLPNYLAGSGRTFVGWYSETGGSGTAYGTYGSFWTVANTDTGMIAYTQSDSERLTGYTVGLYWWDASATTPGEITPTTGQEPFRIAYTESISAGSYGLVTVSGNGQYSYGKSIALSIIDPTSKEASSKAKLVQVDDHHWMIASITGNVMIKASVTTETAHGVSDLHISGTIGANEGVAVTIGSDAPAGLDAGTLTISGTYVKNGKYGAITSSIIDKVDGETATEKSITVGMDGLSVNFTLKDGYKVHYAYAVYTDSSYGTTHSVGIIGADI